MLSGGRVGGPWAGITLIVIHHTGAKSGVDGVSPLAYSLQGDSRFAIWAANGGSPTRPNWYHNLKANPRITAEVGTQTFTVLAEELDDAARAEVWPKLVAQYPQLDEAQATTTRQIPVFMLTDGTDRGTRPRPGPAGTAESRGAAGGSPGGQCGGRPADADRAGDCRMAVVFADRGL